MKKRYRVYIGIVTIICIVLLIMYPINKKIYINENKIKGNLVVWTTDQYYDYFKKISKDIELENKNVKVDIVSINKDEYLEKIENSKEEDLPNVGVLDFQQISRLKNKANLKKINTDIIGNYSKNFNVGRLQEIKEDEGFYGLPFTSNPIVLYIEKQVLEKYNFKDEDIKTWDNLIKVGKKIKEESQGEYNIFSREDEKNIKYLISAELVDNIEESFNKEDIINKVNSIYKDEYIGNDIEKPIFRFASIDFLNKDIYKEGKWFSINPPSFKAGENKFFDIGGENLVVLRTEKNEKLIETFLISAAIKKENLFEELEKYSFIPSSLYAIKIKGEEELNKETLSTLINIVEKAPKIDNYQLFEEVNKEINY